MRLRSREQQPVPSPLRKRTRSAIKSRSSSRSSSVSRISNSSSSSRSKRARIVSPDRSECKVVKRKVKKSITTETVRTRAARGEKPGTSASALPVLKSPKKRGRPLKRPRIKASRCASPTPPASPVPKACSTPEQTKNTRKSFDSPPHKQAPADDEPVANIQTENCSQVEEEIVIASVPETSNANLDDSCPTIEPDSSSYSQQNNAYYTNDNSSGHSSQGGSAASTHHQNIASGNYNPAYFMRHITPQTEAMKNRAAILPCKTRKTPEYTLVLDLDETLVHCTLAEHQMRDYEFTFPIRFQNVDYEVFVKTRPYFRNFLERMCEHFEIIIFTASKKVYADKLISIIDPDKRLVRHRLFREHCILVQGNYIKDLTILGRDLTKTIIVDNSPQAFSYHMDNGIPIESWYSNPEDQELELLEKYLYDLVKFDDVRPELRRKYRIRDQVEGRTDCTLKQLKQYF